MSVYIITITLSVFFAYAFSHMVYRGKEIPKWVTVMITALPAILVTGFRFRVGSDYEMYHYAFLHPENVNVKKNFEPINRIIFKIISYFGGSFYVVVFIASAIFFVLVYTEIFRDSPMPWLSTFMLFGMLFFFIYMNAERQMIADSILLFSLRFLEKKKYPPFIVCLAVAICIHKSSILFILVLLIFQIDISPKIIFGLTPVIFATSAFFGKIVNFFAKLLQYENYIQLSAVNISFRFVIGILCQLFITILACYVYGLNDIDEDQGKFRLFFNIQVLSFWTYAFSGFITGNEIARIRYMFTLSSIIFVPMVIRRIPERVLKLLLEMFVVVYGIFNIYFLIFINNEQQTLPFQTIFSILN